MKLVVLRITDACIFRRQHTPVGTIISDATPEEAALLIGAERAVRHQPKAPPAASSPARETASVEPRTETADASLQRSAVSAPVSQPAPVPAKTRRRR